MAIGGIQGSSMGAASIPGKVSSAYVDPKDTNQDGFVSPAEARAYALKHPFAEALSRMKADLAATPKPAVAHERPYDGKGGTVDGGAGGRWLDTYV